MAALHATKYTAIPMGETVYPTLPFSIKRRGLLASPNDALMGRLWSATTFVTFSTTFICTTSTIRFCKPDMVRSRDFESFTYRHRGSASAASLSK